MSIYGDKKAFREKFKRRIEGFRRFEEWEAKNPQQLDAETAIAIVGELYELLDEEARSRPIDPSGIMKMHEALSVLSENKNDTS